jgi:hypothetical protein
MNTPNHDIPDDEPWRTTGDGRTIGQRFAEERVRWEARSGRSMVGVMMFSKQRLNALQEHDGALVKPGVLEALILLGIDVRYIYHGERTYTAAELAIRDAYRLGTSDERWMIRQGASAVRITRARSSDADQHEDAQYAGADTVLYRRS